MIDQDDFTRVNNDTNGNPRYVCHFLRLNIEQENGQDVSEKYLTALARSREFGGRKFHNKQYGGGIVFQCYNLRALCQEINAKMESEAVA